ncbi:hypothetical protein ACYSTU_25890 [Pseudomonas glycinis]
MSGDDDVERAAAFASRLAPTGVLVAMKMVDLPRISVEASLLAKAQCQAMTMLNVPPPSRASSLPFWLFIQNRDKSKGCTFGPKADILRFTPVREPDQLHGQPLPG